jgi:predicted metal-binding protein
MRGMTKNYDFDILKERAIELGAISAKIIPAKNIVIENRVVLKCKLGCEKYGKTLACPPYAPTPDQFRKIANEYNYAMFLKFKSTAQANSKLIPYLTRTNDPTLSPTIKKKVDTFWSIWNNNTKKLLKTVIALEKEAAKAGYILAVGFVSGSCQLCEKCNVKKGVCNHPELRRFSEEGVGVNVKSTAEKAGVEFTLPFEKNPETFALLLID